MSCAGQWANDFSNEYKLQKIDDPLGDYANCRWCFSSHMEAWTFV
jgi:hypothetical protein